MTTPSYYAIITANVRYDNRICPNAKLLYAEITALTNATGYCWAQNRYFADLYQVSTETISRWISSLRDAGYVEVEIDKPNGNTRKMWLTQSSRPIDENINTYCAKDQDLLTQSSRPIDENINSSSQNTKSNTKQNSKENKEDTHAQDEVRFTETETLLDYRFKTEVNETLSWLLNKKGVHKRNLPTIEWLNWFQDLELEKIDLAGFKEFYEFCEAAEWIQQKRVGITPNVMRRELENFKNRNKPNGNTRQPVEPVRYKSAAERNSEQVVRNFKALAAERKRIAEDYGSGTQAQLSGSNEGTNFEILGTIESGDPF